MIRVFIKREREVKRRDDNFLIKFVDRRVCVCRNVMKKGERDKIRSRVRTRLLPYVRHKNV